MSYPRKYPTGDGSPLGPPDWNTMVDYFNGLTASGIVSSPYSFFVREVGGYYEAIDGNGNLIYGGDDDAGGVDGSDAKAVMEATFGNNRLVVLEPTTFTITSSEGVKINATSNFMLYGLGATIIQDCETTPASVLEVYGACSNVVIYGLILDQDRDNQTPNESLGLQWVARVGGGGGGSENIYFVNCVFKNGLQSHVVVGTSKHIRFHNCLFHTCGEHPFYFNAAYGDTEDITIEACTILNWAKLARGYGVKIGNGVKHVHVAHSYFEPNEDGNGFPSSGPYGDYGAYGYVIDNCTNIVFRDCNFIGDGNENTVGTVQNGSHMIFFNRIYAYDFNLWAFKNQNVLTAFSAIKDCIIDFNETGYLEPPCYAENCTFIDQGSVFTCTFDNGVFKDCRFIRTTVTHDFILIDVNADNWVFDGCRFFNWTYRGIWADGSNDCVVRHCHFDGGVTSSWVKFGTRTIIENCVWENDTTNGVYALNNTGGSSCGLAENSFGSSLSVSIDRSNFEYIKNNIGYRTENSGTATFSGDGNTKVFNITHGCIAAPKAWVQAGSFYASADRYVTTNSTNIIVNYITAPPSGTNNVVLLWETKV